MKQFEDYLKEFGFDLFRMRNWLKSYGINELTMVTVFEEFFIRFEKGERPANSHPLDKMILNRCREIEYGNFKDLVNDYLAAKLSKYKPSQEIFQYQEKDELFPTFKKGGRWITGLLRLKVISRQRPQS